jgi:hypothetical protein
MIEAIQKVRAAREIIARPLPDEMKFRPGHEMLIKEAQASLPGLLKNLASEVYNVSVPVYVVGPKALDLAKLMAEETPAAVIDLNELYDPVTARITLSISGNEFGINQFSMLLRELRQLAVDNDLAALDRPEFIPETFQSTAELRRIIAKNIEKIVGNELTVNYIKKRSALIASEVVTEKVPVFPVMIVGFYGDQTALTKRLFKRNLDAEVYTTSETVVDSQSAVEALKLVKQTLKESTKKKDK